MSRQLKTIEKGQAASELTVKASHVIENLISAYQRKSLAAEKSDKVCSYQLLYLLTSLVICFLLMLQLSYYLISSAFCRMQILPQILC